MGEEETRLFLSESDGVSAEDAFFAVKAAKILVKDLT
jgi:hypothetical protein